MKNPRKNLIKIRVNDHELARLQMLAKIYADGNLSKWLRWAGTESNRKFLPRK